MLSFFGWAGWSIGVVAHRAAVVGKKRNETEMIGILENLVYLKSLRLWPCRMEDAIVKFIKYKPCFTIWVMHLLGACLQK